MAQCDEVAQEVASDQVTAFSCSPTKANLGVRSTPINGWSSPSSVRVLATSM